MLYNLTLKFETSILVKAFDKDFEAAFARFDNSLSRLGNIQKIEHTLNISNSPVIPDNEQIEAFKQAIVDSMTDILNKQNNLNAVVQGVEFIGITSIQKI